MQNSFVEDQQCKRMKFTTWTRTFPPVDVQHRRFPLLVFRRFQVDGSAKKNLVKVFHLFEYKNGFLLLMWFRPYKCQKLLQLYWSFLNEGSFYQFSFLLRIISTFILGINAMQLKTKTLADNMLKGRRFLSQSCYYCHFFSPSYKN